MSFSEILNSDSGLALVGSVIGAVWTFFRSSDWFARRRSRRFSRSIRALEVGVERAYRSYVRAIKKARKDGKLTDREIEHARRMARETAIRYGRTTGVDVLSELGEEYLDLWLSKTVRQSRQRA